MRAAHHGFKNGRRSSQKVFTPFPYLRIREVLAMTVRNYLWGHRYHGTCIYGGARGCRCGVISSAITIGNCYRIQRLKSMIGYKVMLCSNTLEVSMMGRYLESCVVPIPIMHVLCYWSSPVCIQLGHLKKEVAVYIFCCIVPYLFQHEWSLTMHRPCSCKTTARTHSTLTLRRLLSKRNDGTVKSE